MAESTSGSAPITRLYAWFSALISEDYALLEDLITHGLPIDVPHPLRHTTALMEATRLGRTTLVSWLLGRGAAPVFLSGIPRGTPLHCAIKRQHWDIAESLLGAAQHGGVVDAYSRTPLHTLCMDLPEGHAHLHRSLIIAQRLLNKGCHTDALDHEGIAALHYCVIHDCMPMAHLLLEQRANPNILTPDTGVSPLMIAALEKNRELAELLLAYGANPQLATKEGTTPLNVMPALRRMSTPRPRTSAPAPMKGTPASSRRALN